MAETLWLEEALGAVSALQRQHSFNKDDERRGVDQKVGLSGSMVPLVSSLVQRLAKCNGVSGAFAAQEGLVMEVEGNALDYDAFAAIAQQLHEMCRTAGDTLALGRPAQAVIAGSEYKVALFFIGDIDVGVIAPLNVSLGLSIASD